MAVVNGEDRPEADGMMLAEFLLKAGFDARRVACELNGQVVPRAQYAGQLLGICDELEIVRFVGGG